MSKALFAAAAFVLLGTAAAQAASGDSCIRRNDIRAWSSPERKTLIVENYAHNKLRLALSGSCAGFGPYDSFQIVSPMATAASCIDRADDVITHWAGERGVCAIVSLEPYDGPLHPKGARHTAY